METGILSHRLALSPSGYSQAVSLRHLSDSFLNGEALGQKVLFIVNLEHH